MISLEIQKILIFYMCLCLYDAVDDKYDAVN